MKRTKKHTTMRVKGESRPLAARLALLLRAERGHDSSMSDAIQTALVESIARRTTQNGARQ